MKWLYLIAAILYLLSPIDILPDFLGLPGRIDDVAILIFVYLKFFRPTPVVIEPDQDAIEVEFTRVPPSESKEDTFTKKE